MAIMTAYKTVLVHNSFVVEEDIEFQSICRWCQDESSFEMKITIRVAHQLFRQKMILHSANTSDNTFKKNKLRIFQWDPMAPKSAKS